MKLTSRSTGVFASTRWVPPVTGVLFLTLVVFAGAFVWQARQMDRRHQFTAHVQEAMEYLNARIEAYNALLRGVAAFAHVHQPISDQAFHDYVAHLQLRQNYPGIQGIGLAARLGPGDPPDATSRIVSWSSYSLDTIWPKGDGASERFPIALLEPRDDRNQKAMGFDMFSEPVRRQAMEQARDTGRATATGRVTLVQEDDTAPMPGFLIYLPLYESAPPPPGESRKLLGFIYAPFRAGDMLGTVLPERLRRVIDVQVYAGEQTDEQSMLFATTPPEQTDGAKLRETRMLDVAGRIWTLHFVSTQPVSAGSALPLTIVGFGLVVSTALFLMSRSLARARDEAERSAQQLLASQRDLHDSRERYRLLLKAANDVTWEWDFATGTIRWNEALRSLGYEPSDPAFDIHAWEQHIHPDDRQRVIDGISACMHDGPDYWSEEYRFERGDGRLAHIYDRGYILRDAQAKPLRMIGAMTDLTHIKEAQEQLRRANETLESRVAQRTASLLIQQKQLRSLASQLTLTAARERRRLAHILHDHIQQLLVAAKMRLSLVRDQVDGPPLEQVAGVFDLLEESIQSSRSLAVEISPPVLYDAGLIAALHWLERRKMGEYQLRVTIDADPDAEPQAEVVRVLLFEATRELLFNVVKHAETLDVTVRLRRLDGEVELSVRDEGVGFDPSRLEQAPGDDASFGLLSVRERLELLGGKMVVDSAPGKGTTVTLTAPMHITTASHPAEPQTVKEMLVRPVVPVVHDVSREADGVARVLIVDDQRMLREGLTLLLEQSPEVRIVGEAGDGQSAVEMAAALKPDVVLMDVTMPGIGGIEATRLIHQRDPEIWIIGLSMHDDENVADAMRRAGACDYLTKGGPAAQLLNAVRQAASRNHPPCGRPDDGITITVDKIDAAERGPSR